MKRARAGRAAPLKPARKASTAVASPRLSTVPAEPPPPRPDSPRPAARVAPAKLSVRAPKSASPAGRRAARIVEGDEESTLLDLIDNLLGKGVVLNADLILALANVDLVYVRLSALLCAADRILPVRRRHP